MFVRALLALLAVLSLLKEFTNRKFVFIKHVQELALTSLLASVLHPVNAHTLFAFVLLCSSVERRPFSVNIVDAMLLIILHHFIKY